MPTKSAKTDALAANSAADANSMPPHFHFKDALLRGLLVFLIAAALGVVLDIIGTFDAQKIAVFTIKGAAGDPIGELTRIFTLLGTLNDFVVAPLVCLCVGVFVGCNVKRWPHITAVLAVVPVLSSRILADFGHTRVLVLAAIYLILTALTSHFAFRLSRRNDGSAEANTEGRKKKSSRTAVRA